MGAFHRSACWTWFDRGYNYHSKKLQISTDVEKKRGRNAVEAWFYTRDGHIWKSWMWLANNVDEWGVFVKYYKTGKEPRSKIYIDLLVCNNL